MTTTKSKWLVTIILAVVMIISAITGITLYKASADEEKSDTEIKTASIIGVDSRPQLSNGLVYFTFATNAGYKTKLESLHANEIYSNYFYLNDKKLVGSSAFPGIQGVNAIHMNWDVGSDYVPNFGSDAQHWAIGLNVSALKTGDKLIIKKGLSVLDGEDGSGNPVYINLDKDYEFIYNGEYDYPYFYREEIPDNFVFATYAHDNNTNYLRVGFNVPYRSGKADLENYQYYRKYVSIGGEEPHQYAGANDPIPVDYIHINYWGNSNDLCLRPNTTYIYFAANGAKEVTLKEGMYVADGIRLDKDYVFTLNEETGTWMINVGKQPITLYSKNSDETVLTTVDYVNSNVSLYIYFNGFSADVRQSMHNPTNYPYISSNVFYNGKSIKEINEEAGKELIWLHLNEPNYATHGNKTTWMMTILFELLNAQSETPPTITLNKGLKTDSGYLDRTYNFVYDSRTNNWSLEKDVIKSFVPCDKDGNEVTLEPISTGIGKTLDLPKYAKAELESGAADIVELSWDAESFATGGAKTVTGTLSYNQDWYVIQEDLNTNLTVSVTVAESIASIAAIEDINTTYGSETALPNTVSATMSDGSNVNLVINWEEGTETTFTPDTVKEYTFNGVADAEDYYYYDGLSFNVTVKVIAAKAKITVTADDVTIKQGEMIPELTFRLTSGSMVGTDTLEKKTNLHANSVADGKTTGTFEITVSGTSAYYDIEFVSGTLTVKGSKGGCGSVASVNGGTAILCVIVSLCAIALIKKRLSHNL